MSTPFGGIPVYPSPAVKEGEAYLVHLGRRHAIYLGEPLSEHKAEARRIVREVMADIRAWYGDTSTPEATTYSMLFNAVSGYRMTFDPQTWTNS